MIIGVVIVVVILGIVGGFLLGFAFGFQLREKVTGEQLDDFFGVGDKGDEVKE